MKNLLKTSNLVFKFFFLICIFIIFKFNVLSFYLDIKILDKDSNLPIENAIVKLKIFDKIFTYSSNIEGKVFISNLPPQLATLKIFKQNYQPIEKTIMLPFKKTIYMKKIKTLNYTKIILKDYYFNATIPVAILITKDKVFYTTTGTFKIPQNLLATYSIILADGFESYSLPPTFSKKITCKLKKITPITTISGYIKGFTGKLKLIIDNQIYNLTAPTFYWAKVFNKKFLIIVIEPTTNKILFLKEINLNKSIENYHYDIFLRLNK